MQHTVPISRFSPLEPETYPALNVIIAYEDFDTGKQAKRTFDLLSQNLGSACHLTNQMWKFDVLTIPKLRDLALKDAAQADIVMVSCHGNEMPEHVKIWLETALQQSPNVLALIALFDDSSAVAAHRYLSFVARRARIEFFAQPRQAIPKFQKSEGSIFQLDSERAPAALTIPAGILRREASSPRRIHIDHRFHRTATGG